jgi:hypothetical protein
LSKPAGFDHSTPTAGRTEAQTGKELKLYTGTNKRAEAWHRKELKPGTGQMRGGDGAKI